MALTDKLTAIADGFRTSRGITDKLSLGRMAELAAENSGLDTTIIEYNQMNPQLTAYLNAAKAYTDTDGRSTTVMSNHLSSTEYDDPVGQVITVTEKGTLYIVDENTGITTKTSVSTGAKTVYNLIPGHVYQWFVKNAAGAVTASGRLKPTGAVRMLKFLYGVRNFRDLGGWACDGGTVKYGLLVRGGFFGDSAADAENRKFAEDVGIKHEIDLRPEGSATTSPIGSHVHYYRFPIDVYYKNSIDKSDIDSYESTIRALRTIFDAVNHGECCYFHCSLGADRCGTLSWMIEALLGMARKDMDKDYELTTFYVYPAQAETRYRTRSEFVALNNYLPSFDDVLLWYLDAGFSIDELNAFRRSAINGTPSTLVAPVVTYTISNALQNCSTSNAATSIIKGEAYSATLTANSGYVLDSVTVKMGGKDITSTAYSGGQITIASVTGDVVITAKAIVEPPKYTNQLAVVGYTNGYRISSSGAPSASSSYTVSGFIPCKVGDVIRFKNITFGASASDQSNHRLSLYDASQAHLWQSSENVLVTDATAISVFKVVLDGSGNVAQITIPSKTSSADLSTVAYLRFNTAKGGITDASIVTVNEEIV